jgi:hypothetical protein
MNTGDAQTGTSYRSAVSIFAATPARITASPGCR